MTTPLVETEPSIVPVPAGTAHQTKGDRFSSFDPADFSVPRSRDEDWRFTPLRRLRGLHDGTAASQPGSAVRARVEVDTAGAPEGAVEVASLPAGDDRIGRAGAPVDYAAAYAWSKTAEADYVRIATGQVLSEPVSITISGPGEDATSFGSLVVDVEAHAEAVVILRYQGSGAHSDNVEFLVGDGARLSCIVMEDWDRGAVHLANSHIQVGRDATVRHTYAAFGGDVLRSVPHVRFTAPGGDAELLGIGFADAGQYFEQRLLVDHSIPNCRSNVLYKAALQGRPTADDAADAATKAARAVEAADVDGAAHAVDTNATGVDADAEDDSAQTRLPRSERTPDARTAWIGDVLIRPEATGTDTYEKNNNLLLTPGARADSVPNLEIQTGEIVGAGHAATVGRFDDEQMFYLRSRGIDEATAKMLIVRGFFTDVIRRIPVASIREQLEAKIDHELAHTVL